MIAPRSVVAHIGVEGSATNNGRATTMQLHSRSRYRARWATTSADLSAAQHLRYGAFVADTGARDRPDGCDTDRFDKTCHHLLIEELATNRLVATCRVLPLSSGADIGQSYSAQFYTLDALEAFDAPMAEMGRFCIAPGVTDPDILRVAWGALTAFVDREDVEMLFGCSSFKGTKTSKYADAFAVLRDRHLAPKRWWPRVKAPDVFRFARILRRVPGPGESLQNHAASAAVVPSDGRLGQRSCRGRPRSEHASCVHGPRNTRHPQSARQGAAGADGVAQLVVAALTLGDHRFSSRPWPAHRFCN